MLNPEDVMAMDGLAALQALIEEKLPPPSISITLGFRLTKVERGFAQFIGAPSDRLLNPLGTVHGGVALTLIDSACGAAAHTTLPAGVGYTTVETKANFTRAIMPNTGEIIAEGRIVNEGRTIITAEAKLVDSSGKLYAHGTSTLLIIRPEKKS